MSCSRLGWVSVVLFVLSGTSTVSAQETKAAPRRPNILWITCEDMGPHIGAYGDRYAVTPNLDRFAKRALRYTKVWSNAPVCAPARTTIISGLYPPTTGSENMRSLVSLPDGLVMFPVLLRRLGYFCTNHIKEDYNLVKTGKVWDESSPKAHYKHRAPGQPFFAVFNLTVTHESQIRTKGHKLVHDPAQAPVPPYHPDVPEVRRDWAQYYDNITTMDRMVGKILDELEAAGLADNTIVVFFSDHGSGMPRNKRSAQNSGLHVPFLVHIPDAHRDLAPKGYVAGGTTDRLVSFVDLAPTMLSLAGAAAPQTMQGKAFLGPLAADPNSHLFGFRNRMDERYDLVRGVRDARYVYVRNFTPHRVAGQHVAYMFETPTTTAWKKLFDEGKLNDAQSQFWKRRPAEELYDLENDPHEVRNLAASLEHRDHLIRLRGVLANHLRQTRDLGFLPEDEMHARSNGITPYELGKDRAKFPVDDIVAMAEIATDGVSDPAKLVPALDHKDAAVRYWGVVGLLARGEAATKAYQTALLKRLDDPAPSVRIVAAEALGAWGDAKVQPRALAVLLELAPVEKHGVYVTFQALNSLEALGEKARPGLEIIRSAARGEGKIEPRTRTMPTRLVHSILKNLGEK